MVDGKCCGDICLLRIDEFVLDVCRDCRNSTTKRKKMRRMDGDILGSDWFTILGFGSICGTCFKANGKYNSSD